MVMTNFTVETVDHDLGGDRCRDLSNPCNKLVFEFTGTLDSMVFHVAPNFEGKYRDPTIENSHLATGYNRSRATGVLVPKSPGLVEAYWQGQWQPTYWETPMGPAIRQPVEWIPNLDLVEGSDLAAPDYFIFSYAYAFGTESRFGARLPKHDAVYTGWTSDKLAYVTVEVETVSTPGRGKKKPGTTRLQFTVQTFKHADTHDRSTTLHAYSDLLFTDPMDNRSLLYPISHGMNVSDPTDLHQSVYRSEPLTVSGCYDVRVIGVDSYGGPTEVFYGDRFYVWDRSKDEEGAAPLGVVFDITTGEITTTHSGGCPS